MGHLHGSSANERRRRSSSSEDRVTPRHGLRTSGVAPAVQLGDSKHLARARELAGKVAGLFPPNFNRALPRGYTLASGGLVILKVEFEPGSHHHLYGMHPRWGSTECRAFLNDVREGWLGELSAFMSWQLRGEPEASARFQAGLMQLTTELTK